MDPEYAEVEELLRSYYRNGADDHSQLVVYVGEKKVIDVWGKPAENVQDRSWLPNFAFLKKSKNRGERPYGPDSLVNIYSSGKTIAAILMGIMEDQGYLDYDEKICKYWPAFAQNGKGHVLVSDILRHEAGLSQLRCEVRVEETQTEAIKRNSMGQKFEKSP